MIAAASFFSAFISLLHLEQIIVSIYRFQISVLMLCNATQITTQTKDLTEFFYLPFRLIKSEFGNET